MKNFIFALFLSVTGVVNANFTSVTVYQYIKSYPMPAHIYFDLTYDCSSSMNLFSPDDLKCFGMNVIRGYGSVVVTKRSDPYYRTESSIDDSGSKRNSIFYNVNYDIEVHDPIGGLSGMVFYDVIVVSGYLNNVGCY